MSNTQRLQAKVAELSAKCASYKDGIANLRTHLSGDKFKGADQDGARKDWIAVADVSRWLDCIENDAEEASSPAEGVAA